MTPEIKEQKQYLRQKIKTQLLGINAKDRKLASEKICLSIKNYLSEQSNEIKQILLFAGDNTEPDLSCLIEKNIAPNRVFAYPRVNGPHLEFCSIQHLNQLKKGAYGLLEPNRESLILASDLFARNNTLVLIPGRAFSDKGNRLGRGGGYYDRTLKNIPVKNRIGISFEIQFLSASDFPKEDHDQNVGKLITENRRYEF